MWGPIFFNMTLLTLTHSLILTISDVTGQIYIKKVASAV